MRLPPAVRDHSKIVFYGGSTFLVEADVYEPAEDTYLMANNLNVRQGEQVLELGTGSGLLAILAAKIGADVIATDINPAALVCARKNASTHKVGNKIDFRSGDLFDPVVGERFDMVIFNPPYLPIEKEEVIEGQIDRAWDGGPDGRRIIDRFLSGISDHLKSKGRAMFLQSSLSDISKTLDILKARCFQVKIEREKIPFEELFLVNMKCGENADTPEK